MSIIINTNLKKSSHRCDPCHYSSKKCDRVLPRCSLCVKRNLACGIFRKLANTKNLFFIEDSITTFSIGPSRKKKGNNLINNKLETHVEKKIPKQGLILEKQYLTHIKAVEEILLGIPGYSLRNNLKFMVHFPSFDYQNDGLKLLVTSTIKLISVIPRNKMIPIAKVCLTYPADTNAILEKAYKSFCNSELFRVTFIDKSNFDINNYSYILKVAITVCGLLRIERDKKAQEVLDYYLDILKQYFKMPQMVEATIDNLQAILILLVAISRPVNLNLWFVGFIENLIRTCYKLGLHIPSPQLSKVTQLKRQKIFNMAMFTASFIFLNTGHLFRVFDKYPNPTRITYLMQDRDYFEKQTINLTYEKQLDLYLTIFNDFLIDAAWALSILNSFKEKIVSKSKSFFELAGDISNFITEFKSDALRSLALLMKLHQFKIKGGNDQVLGDYITQVKLFIHYVNFFALTLNFFHKESKNFKSDSEILPLFSKSVYLPIGVDFTILSLSIYEAISAIESICSMTLNHLGSFDLAILSQCLLFLIRNRENAFKDKTNEKIEAGLSLLRLLKESPYNSPIAINNLAVLDVAISIN